MAKLRQNAYWLAPLTLLPLLAVIFYWGLSPVAQRTLAQEQPTPLADDVYDRIHRLRSRAGFDNEALAVANLSTEQLAGVLPAVRNWYSSNRASWEGQLSLVADLEAALRALRSRMNSGEDVGDQMNTARENLAAAQAALESTVASMRNSVLTGLLSEQRSAADLMYARRSQPMLYRALNLDSNQATALDAALVPYAQIVSHADSDEQRAAALDAFLRARASAIGPNNETTLVTLAGYLPAAAERVTSAVAEHLTQQ